MSVIITTVSTSNNTGTLMVPSDRALRLVMCLAMGEHPWRWEGMSPMALDRLPRQIESLADIVGYADGIEANGAWDTSTVRGWWRPNVTLIGNRTAVWRPWSGNDARRKITVTLLGKQAEIRWDTGKNRGSSFIGGCLVAVSGGLSNVPPGTLRLQVIELED